MSTKDVYLIVQNVRSLFNVGAIFRCADVFGVKKIFLCGYTGAPPRIEITKTALGAEVWIPWKKHGQTHLLIKKLKQQGIKIAVLEISQNAKPLPKFKPIFPLALVVGSETRGVSKKIIALADEVVKIPMLGKKESLNVAVAAGIALYQLRN
ncbi:MAG TPA: TrmH family RNA methyltransferase [Patescibacteria group bacterium]|nr:TrmH family RNA methyltransferase [Patescibacteria group bacterium]